MNNVTGEVALGISAVTWSRNVNRIWALFTACWPAMASMFIIATVAHVAATLRTTFNVLRAAVAVGDVSAADLPNHPSTSHP